MTAKRNKMCDREDIIGLDINDGRLTAAHFIRSADGVILNRLAFGDYEPQLPDHQIATVIREFWKKERFSTRLVCTCLRSRALMVRYFQYANLSVDELAMALSLEAEEALRLSSDELCIDWHLDPVICDQDGKPENLTGILVAAPRKTVRRHLELIKAAGLYSVNVEVSCSALCNCYSFFTARRQTKPVCLVNLTDRTADIIMYTDGGVYPRTLFSSNDGWKSNTEYLLENIQNALLYYHLKIKHNPVEKIFLVGKIPAPDQFPEHLARKVSLPVELFNACDHPSITLIKRDLPLPVTGSCNITTAIGLALREVNHEPA